jgi:hypothetical protein
MRSVPFVFGFVLGVAMAAVTGCPSTACSPATCATGCCDSAGRCQMSSSSSACGTRGALCTTCGLAESCVAGMCTGANPGTAGGSSGTGGGFSGTGGGTAPNALTAYLDTVANAYCAKLIECGQLPGTSVGDCVAVYRPSLSQPGAGALRATLRGVRLGASSFDAAKAAACVEEIRRAVCTISGPQGRTDSCLEVTAPAAGPNAACDSSLDCRDVTTGCNGPRCMQRCTAGGVQGEQCRRTDPACDAPFVCVNNVCATEPPPGTPCQDFSGGAGCGPNGVCRSGVCERLPASGQSCLAGQCRPGLYCDVSRICRDLKPVGTSCSTSSECAAGAFCRTVCTPRGTPGALCRSDAECVETASCFQGSCRTQGAMGATCLRSSDCSGALDCDDELRTCRAFTSALTGQPCSSTRPCQSSLERCRNSVINRDGGVGSAGICGVPAVGDACAGSFACGSGQYCDPSGVCLAAGASTPCSFDSQCRDSDFCSNSTRRCTPRVATGQPCTSWTSCAVLNERCLGQPTDGGAGRCGPLPTLGQPCSDVCVLPLACQNGTCVAAGRLGQPCIVVSGASCFSGPCLQPDGGFGFSPDSRCAAPLPNGSFCRLDLDCQSGLCERNSCVAPCN